MTDKHRIDSHKLDLHPQRVAQWMEADTWDKAKKVYPLYWEITTSAFCQHRCTFCSVDAIGYPAIYMDDITLQDRMVEAGVMGVKSVMFAGTGEPLVHKKSNKILYDAVIVAGLDAAFTTNGVLLNRLERPELCSWIKISLNAGTRDSYAAVHKTDPKDWDKVWTNIRSLAKRKGPCTLGVQCVVLPETFKEMKELAALCWDAGADYFVMKPYSQGTFSIVQREVNYSEMENYLQEVKEYATDSFDVIYRENAMHQEAEDHHYDKCRATPTFWVYSMANGDVFTCSAHLLDPRFCIGNLNTQTFQEIWEGEGRREQWELMKSFDINQCRLNCRMNQTNIYLDQLAKPPAHINFI